LKHTKERKYEAKIIGTEGRGYKRPAEASPEPGQYMSQTITFGSNMKKIDMGKKYEFKADSNPKVGQYN